MKLNHVFGILCLLGLVTGLPMCANGIPPMPWAIIAGALFWIGLIGFFAAKPSKAKRKQEDLEERLRELELRNKIAEAEERLQGRSRDA